MDDLTEKQRQILQCVTNAIHERGQAPTVRDIGVKVGLSSSCSVKKHLDNLIAKGYLQRDRYKRSIVLCDDGEPVTMGLSVFVPLLGRVAGGSPTFAEQTLAPEMLPLPQSFFGRGMGRGEDLFALEVCGNSMRDVGISNGDLVVACRQSSARNGDIVVAMIDDEATVKTFYKEKEFIRLQPENPDFEPILVRDVTIIGKVALSIKRFN